MKKIVPMLAITTLAFAVSTAYYARALKLQRDYTARVTASGAPQTASGPGVTLPPKNSTGTAPIGVPQEEDLETKVAAARARLDRFKDPAQRTQIAARTRTSLADTWKPIAASLQLGSDELDRLLDTLTGQVMGFDQHRLECQIDPSCDSKVLEASIKESALQNMAHSLGPAGFEKWNAYRDAIPERVIIQELRKNLPPASALTDAEAERLVMALADERHKVVERAAQLGKKVQVALGGFAIQEFQGEVAPRPFGPTNKEMTKDFNSRLRSRAAQNLSREQLAEFTKMQDEQLKNAAFMEALLSLSEKR